MAECLETQLAGIRSPVGEAPRLCLDHEIILTSAHGPGDVASEGDLSTSQVVLSGMIDVNPCNIHGADGFKVVDVRLDSVGVATPIQIKVLRQELVRAVVLANERCLPRKILGHQAALELGEGGGEAGVDGAVSGREVFPAIDSIAPIVQAEVVIQGIE